MPGSALPIVEYRLENGLVERFKQDMTGSSGGDMSVSGALSIANNVDTYDIFGATGKLPGSSRKSDTMPGSVTSIHPFEYFEKDGTLTRQILSSAGTALYKVNSDQSLTTLGSGYIAEAWSGFTTLDRLHLISKNNAGVKWDGTTLTKWGIDAPGSDPNIHKRFDTVGAAPPTGPDVTWIPYNGTAVSDTTIARDGYAISLTKTSTGTNTCYIEQAITTGLVATALHNNAIDLWVYIPSGELAKLSQTASLYVYAGSDTQVSTGITIPNLATNYNYWAIGVGELYEGWNLLSLGLSTTSTSIAYDSRLTISGSPTNSNLKAIRVGFTSLANSTLPAGIRFSKLQSYTRGNLTSAEGSAGSNFTSAYTYNYKVTFVNQYGFESNAGPKSADLLLTLNRDSITLTDIPVSSDSQVVARRLYRSLQSDEIYEFVTQIDNNTATTFTDNIPDESRSVSTPPEAGDSLLDHTPPSPMAQVVYWQNIAFGIDAYNRFQINMSDVNQPEAWPYINTLTMDEEITALVPTLTALYIFTSDSTFILTNTLPSNFRVEKLDPEVGCIGPLASTAALRLAITWHDDGPYLRDMSDNKFIGASIKDTVDALEPRELRNIFMVHDRARYRVIMFAKSTYGGYFDTILSYQYGTQKGDLTPSSLLMAPWSKIVLPSSVHPTCAAIVERTADQPEVWFGTTDGILYRLNDPDTTSWAVGSLTEAITATIETHYGQMGSYPGQYSRPRYFKVKGKADVATVWNVTLTMADDVNGREIGTSTFNVTVGPGRTSNEVSVPGMNTHGAYCKVKLINTSTTQGGQIESCQLKYIPVAVRNNRS